MNRIIKTLSLLFAFMAMTGLALSVEERPDDFVQLAEFRDRVAEAFPDVAWSSVEEPADTRVAPVPDTVPVVRDEVTPAAEPVVRDVEPVAVEETIPSVAVFVRNQTRLADLNEEIDAIRSTLAAELSMYDLAVIDSADLMDRFRQNRLPGDPDLREMVSGLSPGGTTVRMAELVDADFVVLLSITSADVRQNVQTGVALDTFTMRFAVRVLDGVTGRSVYGETFERRHPRRGGATGDTGIYFRDVISRAMPDVAKSVADSRSSWPAVERPVALASFTVRTNLDHFVNGLEHGVRGPVDLLDEVRRLVGGTTVLLNGVAIGSTPGTFQAAPGLHILRIEREWMATYEVTVHVRDGLELNVALELSDAGLQRFSSLEGVRAALAVQYAEAAWRRGIRVNFDTEAWQNVVLGGSGDDERGPGVNVNVIDVW